MIIRVLPELESREHWLAFIRREQPYCLIEAPECLVDFQTSFLQLTLLERDPQQQHQDPERYTLGARHSMQPAWALIKACDFSLRRIVAGLQQLDFSSSVRDNALLGVHGDITIRKRFAREPNLVSPSATGLLPPLRALPEQWSGESLCRLLANGQWRDWRAESDEAPSPRALLLALQQSCDRWQLGQREGRLVLRHAGEPQVSLLPDLRPPRPRLLD